MKPWVLARIERVRAVLPLVKVLAILGVSNSQFHAWRYRHLNPCPEAEADESCPRRHPQQMSRQETATMHEMAISTELRHMPGA